MRSSKRPKKWLYVGDQTIGQFCLDLVMKHYNAEMTRDEIEEILNERMPLTGHLFNCDDTFAANESTPDSPTSAGGDLKAA